ncbi:MAG TPA: hypothetical protein VFS09_03095 [Candidatus Eisenbacteria bacterium]|nr:hypothetical protein [Candidatus Eisenbacteria bacterium]
MKHVWWLIVAAVTAAIVLTYILLAQSRANAAPVANPPGLIAFYPRVAARAAKPPAERSLRVLSDWTAEDGSHVTFVSPGKRLSILVVFSKEKFKKPEEALFLAPRYVVAKDMKAVREGREPLVRSTAGEVTEWGYVYDRNGDGRADYLCYLAGPMPVEDDSFPADFPTVVTGLSHEQLEFMLDRDRYVFSHVADEDFDGTVDAIVVYVRDPARPWVKEFATVLAPGAGAPDSSWTFRGAISAPTGALPRVNGGFLRHRVAGKDVVVTSSNFKTWGDVLARINAAAAASKAKFPTGP